MKTTNRFALVLALALGATAVGCGPSDSSNTGDDGGGGGGGSGGDGSGSGGPPRPLDASGTYTMHSTFDLASNAPGTAGTVVNTIIDATDDADDPTRWIVDQIIAQLPSGTVKTALSLGKELVVGYLNGKLLDIAPDFLTTMIQVGHDFGEIAKHVRLNETLQLTGGGSNYTAVHTVTGAHFKLDNQELDFALATYHVPNVVVSDVAVAMDATGQLTIAPHDVPLAYGKLLRLGLDGAIIPLIDPSAGNLNDLFAHTVDCTAVGNAIASALSLSFAAGTLRSACTLGLTAGANFVYAKIDAIDGTALKFELTGSARGLDKNNDRTIDTIVTGSWTGTLSYGTTPSPLAPATFFGERM